MDRAGQQVSLILSFSCSISYFSVRHLAERVEDIFYQRPADNEGLQMKYLAMRADETGGIMKMEDLEIVYRDVGMSRYYIAKPNKNCDISVYDANGVVKERPLHCVTEHLTRGLKMSKFTPR